MVYDHAIECPFCKHVHSGYLNLVEDGKGATKCPNCGASIVRELPPDYLPQLPPTGLETHAHHSFYPGIYSLPKYRPRLDFRDLLRVAYSPKEAFRSLYLTTDLRRAIALVILFSILSTVISVVVTVNVAEVIGFDTSDAILLGGSAFIGWIVSLFSFLLFSVLSATIAHGIFNGRGDRTMSITLIGYCYPWFVVLNVLYLVAFEVSFEGFDLTQLETWSESDLASATAGIIATLAIVVFGITWLLWISGRAISVANDISMAESIVTAVFSVTLSGIVYYVFSRILALPLGLSF